MHHTKGKCALHDHRCLQVLDASGAPKQRALSKVLKPPHCCCSLRLLSSVVPLVLVMFMCGRNRSHGKKKRGGGGGLRGDPAGHFLRYPAPSTLASCVLDHEWLSSLSNVQRPSNPCVFIHIITC